MKKIFRTTYFALLLIAGLSCNNDPMPDAPKEQRPISFDNIATRADESTLADLQKNGFGVWAIVNNDLVEDLVLMDNQKVEYDNTASEWHYTPVQYWIDKTKFTFLATYPYYDENESVFSFNEENTSIKLSVAETPSDIDFLIAENITDTSVEGYSETVDLQFNHVLTSVELKIWRDYGKHQNDQMRIKKVTLGNIRKGGVYSTATDAWTYNGNMTVEKENTNLTDSDNIGAVEVKDDGTLDPGGSKPASPFGQMMLLPQTLDASNSVSLKIVYQLKRNNAADWEEAELETVLPYSTWKAGNRYTYNVVLSSVTDITIYYIQTKVDPWGTPQVGGTVIIK